MPVKQHHIEVSKNNKFLPICRDFLLIGVDTDLEQVGWNMSCCYDNHSSLFKLPSWLKQMNNTLQFRVAPRAAVAWQPMRKQRGRINRERSLGGSREGQSAQGAAQVLAWSALQRLVVFADSQWHLVTAGRRSPAHATASRLPGSCTFPQPHWKSAYACVPPDAVFQTWKNKQTKEHGKKNPTYLNCCELVLVFLWLGCRLKQISAYLTAPHQTCGTIYDHGPLGPWAHCYANLYQYPNPVTKASHSRWNTGNMSTLIKQTDTSGMTQRVMYL